MAKKKNTQEDIVADCQACGSRCCKYFCFEIDKPTSFGEFENVRWYLMHQDVTVHIDSIGDWYIALNNRCLNLDENNRCKQYANRPLICRAYHTDGCDFTQGDYEYQAMFRTAEELENYARQRLGPARYDKIKAGAYRKIVEKQQAKAARRQAKRKATNAPRAKRSATKKRQEVFEPLMDLEA